MGSCILQDRRLVPYWSKSLSPVQKNYRTTEKELLAIVLILKEYRRMLLGGKLVIYTDHENLMFRTLSTHRILQWTLYIDGFDFELKYLEGEKNVLADCFSRFPRIDEIWMGNKELKMIQQNKGTMVDFKQLTLPQQDELLFPSTKPKDWAFDHVITTRTRETTLFPQTCNHNDTDVIKCPINLPSLQELPNPLTIINIWNHHLNDPWLI